MGKAILTVDYMVLEGALHLPEGYRIVAAQPDMVYRQVQLLLESETILETQEGRPYPHADALVTVEYAREQPDHRRYMTQIKVRDD